MTTPPGSSGGTKARAARLGVDESGRRVVSTSVGGPTPSGPTPSGPTPSGPAGSAPAPPPDARELGPDELVALEEQRAFLLGSLRDLEAEHEVGDVDDADYEELQDDYTARAAAVIRAIEGHHALVAARRTRWSWGRRLAVLVVVVVVAIGTGVFVAHSAGQRNAGDTVSGGTRQSTRDQLLTARQLQQTGKYPEAIKAYDEVLKIDPTNVEALSYRGWMLRLVALQTDGENRQLLQTKALEFLNAALQVEPTNGTALVFLAVLQGDLGQPQAALDTLAKVPEGQVPDFMAGTIESFRQKAQAQLAAAKPAAP
jgi:tetratricopeptide (TPR) repeat protein